MIWRQLCFSLFSREEKQCDLDWRRFCWTCATPHQEISTYFLISRHPSLSSKLSLVLANEWVFRGSCERFTSHIALIVVERHISLRSIPSRKEAGWCAHTHTHMSLWLQFVCYGNWRVCETAPVSLPLVLIRNNGDTRSKAQQTKDVWTLMTSLQPS